MRGAKKHWVKKSCRNNSSRLKIATYNVRILLRDEHVQKREEEHRETCLVWDVIEISEVRRPEQCFNTLHSGHRIYHSKANNGESGFLIKRTLKDHIVRLSNIIPRMVEHVLCIVKRHKLKIVLVHTPTTSYSEDDINSSYKDVD